MDTNLNHGVEASGEKAEPHPKAVTVPPHIASVLITSALSHGLCFEPTPNFCMYQNRLHQLWRDRISGAGEFRPVEDYNPSLGYPIAP